MNSKISDKDKKDWNDFLSKENKLPDKDLNFTKKKFLNNKTLDLHGYSLDEANKVVENCINESYEKGILQLKIVTGKGLHSQNIKNPYISKDLGILKHSVPDFIFNNKNLMSKIKEIKEAQINDGGSGAIYILLKKPIK